MKEMEGNISPEISQPKITKTEGSTTEPKLKEKPREGFNFTFYTTDHAPRFADTGSPDRLRALYKDIKKDGIDQVRSDWDWNLIERNPGEVDSEQLERFQTAAKIMKEEGLDPLIILSNPPDWAKKMYEKNPQEFVESFRKYTDVVKSGVEAAGITPETVQVLNELNNPAYTPVTEMQTIGELSDATREAFPESKIMVSVLASAIPEAVSGRGFSEDIHTFLPKLKEIKDKFDVLAIDYYPGAWQRTISGEGGRLKNLIKRVVVPGKEEYKEMFKDVSLFRETAEEVASWGKEYELGETGFPVKGIYWGNERRQRYFYDAFFRSLKDVMLDFRERGIKLPSKIGLYQAQNEPPRNFIGKIMRKTPYPEFNWGMRDDEGNRNLILQGIPHASEQTRMQQESRLSRIIHYMRAPMKRTEELNQEHDNLKLQEVRSELDQI